MQESLTPHETAFDPANDKRWWGFAVLSATYRGAFVRARNIRMNTLSDTNRFNVRLIRFLLQFMLCSSELSAVGG
jgi:hypothetical protein